LAHNFEQKKSFPHRGHLLKVKTITCQARQMNANIATAKVTLFDLKRKSVTPTNGAKKRIDNKTTFLLNSIFLAFIINSLLSLDPPSILSS